jgi:hypothetical protein
MGRYDLAGGDVNGFRPQAGRRSLNRAGDHRRRDRAGATAHEPGAVARRVGTLRVAAFRIGAVGVIHLHRGMIPILMLILMPIRIHVAGAGLQRLAAQGEDQEERQKFCYMPAHFRIYGSIRFSSAVNDIWRH